MAPVERSNRIDKLVSMSFTCTHHSLIAGVRNWWWWWLAEKTHSWCLGSHTTELLRLCYFK